MSVFGSSALSSLNLLNNSCNIIYNDLENFEQVLEMSQETETKISTKDSNDEEKQLLLEKIKRLESQQKLMKENYIKFQNQLKKQRTAIFKYRQKIRYKYTEDERYHSPVMPLSFDDLHKHIFTPKNIYSKSKITLSNQQISEILQIINVPKDLSNDDLINFYKKKLAYIIKEKEQIAIDISKKETFLAIKEELEDISKKESESKYYFKTGTILWKEKNDSKWKTMMCILSYIPEKQFYMLRVKQQDKNSMLRIYMPWCVTQISSDPKIKQDFCITLIPRMIQKKRKTYFLSFSSPHEMTEWLSILEHASIVTPDLTTLPKLGFKLIETEHAKSL